MGSSLARKLAALAIVLIASTLFILDRAISGYARERQAAQVEDRLLASAQLIGNSLSSAPPPETLQAWARSTQSRVQLLDSRGKIVADSLPSDPPLTISSDPEVLEAERGRTGTATRAVRDSTLAWVAAPAISGALIVRLSAPLDSADPRAGDVRRQVLAISLGGAALALAIGFMVAYRLTRRVNRLKAYAESLLDAPLSIFSYADGDDELGSLERSLSRVAVQLRELFERWKQESSRSEAILSSMAEGVLAVDKELRVVFCNQAMTRTMGVRQPTRERMRVIELVRDAELVDILNHVVASGESIKRNLKISAASGRVFEVQAAPFGTTGGKGALAIFYDMTDLERLEQVRKDFVANVSHEMRTPLAAIVGYSDTLLEGALEDPVNNRRFVEIMRASAIRLNSIASDLLVLSELESGTKPGEPERVPVRSALESAMAAVEPEARNTGVRIVCGEIDDVCVLGYRFRLEQAILNLLVNAVKFNREGGEVRIEARQAPAKQIRIAISDTGVGIPSQDLPRIFERFYRVDKARSRRVGGTGLGLSIVRHVVESMNGNVKVESQLGKGSTFTISLPVC